MPNDFVIFTRARSGSNSLVSRLNSCPDVACHGEIFKRGRIDIARAYRRRLPIATVRRAQRRPVDFIAGIRALDPQTATSASRSSRRTSTARPGVIAHIAAPATRRIVLTRAPLETYASFLRMRATGVHKLKAGETPPPEALDRQGRASPKRTFRRFAAGYNRFMAMARLIAAIPGSFVIDYAQINDPEALDALFGFVGSTARAADSAHRLPQAVRRQPRGRLRELGRAAGLPADRPGPARRRRRRRRSGR